MKTIPHLKSKDNLYLSYQEQGFDQGLLDRLYAFIEERKNKLPKIDMEKIETFFKEMAKISATDKDDNKNYSLIYSPYNLVKNPTKVSISIEENKDNIKTIKRIAPITDDFIKIVKNLLNAQDKKEFDDIEQNVAKINGAISQLNKNAQSSKINTLDAHEETINLIYKRYDELNVLHYEKSNHIYSIIKELKNPFKIYEKICGEIDKLAYEETADLPDDEKESYMIMGKGGKFYPAGSNKLDWVGMERAKLFSTALKAENFIKMKKIVDYAIIKVKVTYMDVISKTCDFHTLDKMISAQENKKIDDIIDTKKSNKKNKNKL